MGKKVANDDSKVYRAFAWRICVRMGRVIGGSWGIFGIVLTFWYFGQGFILLVGGRSGTMTPEFEASWLALAVGFGSIAFVVFFVVAVWSSVCDFKKVRRDLKMSTSIKDSKKYITEATFEQFESEVRGGLAFTNERLDNIEARINDRLKNIETTLKSLVEDEKKNVR